VLMEEGQCGVKVGFWVVLGFLGWGKFVLIPHAFRNMVSLLFSTTTLFSCTQVSKC
jgi:hypothetical protein